jgi:myo-inositol 2-dehydrogenase / D-chiro-inositol 1-dehydrogenase
MSLQGRERLGFAVVGCGALAQSQHIPNIARSPRAFVHTCCDVSDQTLEACTKKFSPKRVTKDFHSAVADPEVKVICLATTEKLRLPVIQSAARAGKPIYVEKPIAREMPEISEIQRIVHETKIPFCAGHNRRCSPAMRDAHRIFREHMTHPKPNPWRWRREQTGVPWLADDGTASFIVRINDDWHSWKNWVFDKEQAPHGPMLFEMTHFTDLCNWFLDDEPIEVSAIETGMLNHAVIIRYRSGALATISMCANGTFGYPKELYEAIGHGGVVAIDHMLEVRTAGIPGAPAKAVYPMLNDRHPQIGQQGGLEGWLEKKRLACEEAASSGDPLRQFTAEPDKGHAHAIEQFIDEIQGAGPVVCGIDDAVLASRVSFAAIRSARERRLVSLSEI